MDVVTLGQNLQTKADVCELLAIHTSDMKLKAFYHNACIGYKEKMLKLTVKELSKVIRTTF